MIVRFRPRALNDLASIRDYIARNSTRAAHAVVQRIVSVTDLLSIFPELGRLGAARTTLELVVPRLPYIVVYRIVRSPDGEFVEVLGVLHAARKRVRH